MAETLYQLDFEQVAQVGRRTKHRPTFPARQLEQSSDPALRESELVHNVQRFHHGEWFIPLVEAYVRTWLKMVKFTVPPVVVVSGVEVTCSVELLPPSSEQVAAWVRHFDSGFFTPAHWRARLQELQGWISPYEKDYHDQEAMRQALRQLLEKEVPPDA